jgi:hypothetical protein
MSPQPTRPGLSLVAIGLVLLASGSILPVRWFLQARKPVSPLVASSPLSPDISSKRLPIHVAEAGPYSFDIAVDDDQVVSQPDPYKVGCLLGSLKDQDTADFHCDRFGKPLKLAWTVRDTSGRVAGQGTWPSGPSQGTLDNEDRKRVLAGFGLSTLTPGEYALDISGLELPPGLLGLHPALESVYENDQYEYTKDWGDLFKVLASGMAALLGLVLAIVGLVRRRAPGPEPRQL